MVEKEEGIKPEGESDRISWKSIERVALIISVLAGLTGIVNDWVSITGSASWIRFVSLTGYLLSVLLLLVMHAEAKPYPKVQTAILVILFIWTGAFFTWVGTWMIPPEVVADSRSFPVEKGDVQAFLYQGVDFGKQGTGDFSVSSSLQNGHISTAYNFSYDLPAGDSFAGVSLYFAQPIDVSNDRYLEFKVSFGDTDARFKAILKESETIFNGVTIGDGKIIDALKEEQTVRLDLSKYYPNVNHKSIRKIDFHADNTFVQGYHEFRVSDVRFTR